MQEYEFAFAGWVLGLEFFNGLRGLFGRAGGEVDFGIVGVEDASQLFSYTRGRSSYDEDLPGVSQVKRLLRKGKALCRWRIV